MAKTAEERETKPDAPAETPVVIPEEEPDTGPAETPETGPEETKGETIESEAEEVRADDTDTPEAETPTTALAVARVAEDAIDFTRAQPMSLTQIGRLGKMFALSGFFKNVATAADLNAAIARAGTQIVAGLEMGIGPMQAMTGIHLVDGRPTLSAGLVGALVKRSMRYRYKVEESTPQVCRIRWIEKVDGEWIDLGVSAFTMEEANDAKLTGKDNWKKYPSDMLFARALTRGARRYCPDVFGGPVYTPEELGDGGPPELEADLGKA